MRLKRIGLLFAAAALVLMYGAKSRATQINTAGSVCQAFNAGQVTDIDYVLHGVRNLNAAGRPVICSIQRAAPTTAVDTTFWVNGTNFSGFTTTGTVFQYGPDGTVRGSQNFSSSASSYTIPLTFSAAQMTFFTSSSALVNLPASVGGTFTALFVAP